VTFSAETFNAELTASESKLAVFHLEVVPMVHWSWVLMGSFLLQLFPGGVTNE
jgi:hypothetical protein